VLKDSPVQDISVMERASAALSLVMKAGVIYKHQV
jgi:hypothetical protein